MDEFFVDKLTAGSTTCGEISSLFDVPDGSTGGTRLNTIFAQLASYENPDFVGMDAALNRLKGNVSSTRLFSHTRRFAHDVQVLEPWPQRHRGISQ